MKKLVGGTDLEDALKRLDKLTNEEARMATAQVLKATHTVEERVRGVADTLIGVDDRVARVEDGVTSVDNRVAGVDERVNGVDDRLAGVDNKVDQVKSSSSPSITLSVWPYHPCRESIAGKHSQMAITTGSVYQS